MRPAHPNRVLDDAEVRDVVDPAGAEGDVLWVVQGADEEVAVWVVCERDTCARVCDA